MMKKLVTSSKAANDKCPADLKSIKVSNNAPATGFSKVHFEVDLDAIEKEIKSKKTYIKDLQAYCLDPPKQALCEFIKSNVG